MNQNRNNITQYHFLPRGFSQKAVKENGYPYKIFGAKSYKRNARK